MHIHPLCAAICTMTPAKELVIHLINLVTATGFLFLAASRDATLLYLSQFDCMPVHTSRLTGQNWIDELWDGHDRQFYNEIGLHKHVFAKLVSVLERDAGIIHTRHVLIEEQVTIFLHYTHWGLSNRALQEWFQRSVDTITK